MSTYLRPQILDRWISILSTLEHTRLTTHHSMHCGSDMLRTQELVYAGLVRTQKGCNGGYQLTLPFEEITLGDLLVIFPRTPCPTLMLFDRFRQMPVAQINGWSKIPCGKGTASIEVFIGILSRLSLTEPTYPVTLLDLGYSVGYMQQIFSFLTKLGLAVNHNRKGKLLIKPFDCITLEDITPELSHRGHVHSSLVARSGKVKLHELQVIEEMDG